MSLQREIEKSMYAGVIDGGEQSLEKYRPKLLVNNYKEGTKVLTSLIKELEDCDEFYFSVAFITYSGVLVLLNTLKELESRNIKGKILASQYLNFTDPSALKKLLSFSNIELRVSTNESLHTKGYIFKKGDQFNVIVGSSNMTQNALGKNKEWNIRISSMEKGSIIKETLDEFNQIFNQATVVNDKWIDAYHGIYQRSRNDRLTKQVIDNVLGDTLTSEDDLISLPQVEPNKMQVDALEGVERIRKSGEKKALLVSATGTGKTYLAAFDVKHVNPKRLLFLAHREQILNQSIESFKRVVGYQKSYGKLSGKSNVTDEDYIFSTVQTMSKDHVLERFDKNYFDYIVVDESHRAGAETYQKILNHFDAKFLLGMTATPERTDEHNICVDFDYNIAYEIRLQEAMQEEMLCPFHYFGITELSIDGSVIDDETEFKYLVSEQRVKNVIDKIKFYTPQSQVTKGLVFCSKNDEAEQLSNAFNSYGYRTIALSGSNSQDEREAAIERLEDTNIFNHLDYIFTVDIFNEGVDIPQINQVIMLRPTKSAIIFVQQLGRGLRKHISKEFVTILDFIGNYKNNFMIPMALSDDRSYNKDNIRRFVAEGSRVIPGCSTINFDEIAKKKIYEAIDSVNFNSVEYIKESYKNLKYRLGRIPTYMDFEEHDSMDLARLFENKSLGSYHNFLKKYEKSYTVKFSGEQELYLKFISTKFAVGKRPHELLFIKAILDNEKSPSAYMKELLEEKFGINCYKKTLTNVLNVLSNEFQTGGARNTYINAKIVDEVDGRHKLSSDFFEYLNDKDFNDHIRELVNFSLYRYEKYYGVSHKKSSFQLYQKYSYEDVCRLLEWEKNMVSLNIGGYKYDEPTKTFPVFINYHKAEDISDTTKYEDRFISNTQLMAISKAKRNLNSNDVKTFINSEELGVNIEIFVRKNKDDKGSKEFYYLGRSRIIGQPVQFKMPGTNADAVEMIHQLETPVREDIYDYLTEE